MKVCDLLALPFTVLLAGVSRGRLLPFARRRLHPASGHSIARAATDPPPTVSFSREAAGSQTADVGQRSRRTIVRKGTD